MRLLVAALLASPLVTSIARAQVPESDSELCGVVTSRTAPAAARSVATQRAAGSSAAALFWQGCLAFGEGGASRAADLFERATEKDATRSLYFDWLGRAYGDQAQRANKLRQPFLAKKTKGAFERAVQLDPGNLDARTYLVSFFQMAPGFLGGSEAKASEQIEAVRARNAYRGGLLAATAEQRRKNTPAMEREYAALVKAFPDSVAPRIALVNLQASEKRWVDAFRTLDAARERFPDARSVEYSVGRIAALSGQQLERGEASLRRYLAGTPGTNEPSTAAAHMRLGQILQKRGQVAEAKAALQQALKLDPALKEAKDALAAMK